MADFTDPPPIDIMNDPSYSVSKNSENADGNADPDHCRICRSEGTPEEPLFHPCKCSGSIKFVHQACLMEWLQHSQKKYCELCKTPFQFTKLYDPAMPNSIPTPLFLRRLVGRLLRNLLFWGRALLVAFVWFGWLPWCVRWMWRSWFWLSDGGWWINQTRMRSSTLNSATRASTPTSTLLSNPASATSPAMGRSVLGLFESPNLFPGTMSPVNGGGDNATLANRNAYEHGIFFGSNPFRNLTRSPLVNRLIIDTVEGQLLTALIVIAFILIFLIREWVVQQQPLIVGDGIGALEDDVPHPMAGNHEHEDNIPAEENVADEEMLERAFGPVPGAEQEHGANDLFLAGRPRRFARVRRRRNLPALFDNQEGHDDLDNEAQNEQQGNQEIEQENANENEGDGSDSREQTLGENLAATYARRPPVSRELMAQAAELRREMEEQMEAAKIRTAGTSAGYNFGAPTDNSFAFINPAPLRPPVDGSENGSPTRGISIASPDNMPERSFGQRLPSAAERDYGGFTSEELDFVDMGTPISNRGGSWGRRRSATADMFFRGSTSGSEPDLGETDDMTNFTPKTTASEESPTLGPDSNGLFGGNRWHYDKCEGDSKWQNDGFDSEGGSNWRAYGDLSQNIKGKGKKRQELENEETGLGSSENHNEDEREDNLNGVESKRKGKDLADSSSRDSEDKEHESTAKNSRWGFNYADDSEEDGEAKSDGSREGGSSGWSVAPQASGHPTQPTTPTDIPTPPRQNEALQVVVPPRLNNEQIREVIRQIDGRVPDDRVRQLLQQIERADQQQVPPINQPQPARGRGAGLWDWFMGDQEAGAINNNPPAHNQDIDDMDTDQEDEADDIGAIDDAVPADLERAMAEEDADDFDGIMELIGMRGPIIGLAQNAAISSVLITATVALGVAFPYVTGKTVMIVLAHPILFFFSIPIAVISFSVEFVVDSSLCLACSFLLMLDQIFRFCVKPVALILPWLSGITHKTLVTKFLTLWATDGKDRVVQKLSSLESYYTSFRRFPPSSIPPISSVTKESWSKISMGVSWAAEKLGIEGGNGTFTFLNTQALEARKVEISSPTIALINSGLEKVMSVVSRVQQNVTKIAEAPIKADTATVLVGEYPVYEWSTCDKVAAVLLGYAFFTFVGAVYLQSTRRNATGYGRTVEKIVVELLSQAGGVMKVVLIIGIEMFAFPLYCGLLLDVALLPLFEDATIISRVFFTMQYPMTSIFVHWFVGTCYMFHFALFVSMCRKIMRSGVLYFIRDPDDPTFHPVKDVLDRPVMMQLRKIGFSAFIYGVLVLVCLGGVVWTLFYTTASVLPIHWSSNEPVLEFPVDLLFYNFFMPVAVKFFKPSDGLQKMYGWWFKKCARTLRLTSFMFGKRMPDEEGFHVRRTWAAVLLNKRGDVNRPVADEGGMKRVNENGEEVYYRRNGRFVRAPASDSARHPKNATIFIPVSEENVRLDNQPDPADGPAGANSPDYKLVYIPPWFRTRIGLVVLGIWIFAAVTGVGVTIGPLLLGRAILKRLVPPEVRLNDIYAFSVGIYIVGGIAYSIAKYPFFKKWCKSAMRNLRNAGSVYSYTATWALRFIKISYVFTAFAIVLPTLFALMIEFYLIIPIHTYWASDQQHVIHFIQDWTLGVLYVKMVGRMLLLDADSPWARALRGVVARGYLDPDVKLATKCFIAPAGGFMLAALLLPMGIGAGVSKVFLKNAAEATISQAYRYSYPAVFGVFLIFAGGYCFKIMIDSWKMSVRDEVYLIGEQLHNHGENKAPSAPLSSSSSPAAQLQANDAVVGVGGGEVARV